MPLAESTLRIRQIRPIDQEVEAFLIDRQARGLSPTTIRFYAQKLAYLRAYTEDHGIAQVEQITAPILRRFLLDFATSHNPWGIHAVYRSVKAFLHWYEQEVEPEGWKNPLPKVKPPKVAQEPLVPVEIEQIQQMLATCDARSLLDLRDKAVLLALLDTGCRASELTALTLGDANMHTGVTLVRHGKGNKARTVFLGAKARRALMAYLRVRGPVQPGEALFAALEGGPLKYESPRDIVRRRAERAGIAPAPTLHSFRRAFALLSLRVNSRPMFTTHDRVGVYHWCECGGLSETTWGGFAG
jgi:site-specific recombinase XerD